MATSYTPPRIDGTTGQQNFFGMNREMWDDYFTKFSQVNDSMLEDKSTELMGEARGNANAAFDSAAGTLDRQRRGLGLRVNAEQAAVDARRMGLGRSLAIADGENRARWAAKDSVKQGQANAMNLRSAYESMAQSMYGQSAQNENQREIDYRIAKAKHSSGLLGLAGKVIGVVAAPFTGGASLALTAASMAGGK